MIWRDSKFQGILKHFIFFLLGYANPFVQRTVQKCTLSKLEMAFTSGKATVFQWEYFILFYVLYFIPEDKKNILKNILHIPDWEKKMRGRIVFSNHVILKSKLLKRTQQITMSQVSRYGE